MEQQIRYVDEYLKGMDREQVRKRYRDYRMGFNNGRTFQHKCEQKDRRWEFVLCAVVASGVGFWLGVALTNGTW